MARWARARSARCRRRGQQARADVESVIDVARVGQHGHEQIADLEPQGRRRCRRVPTHGRASARRSTTLPVRTRAGPTATAAPLLAHGSPTASASAAATSQIAPGSSGWWRLECGERPTRDLDALEREQLVEQGVAGQAHGETRTFVDRTDRRPGVGRRRRPAALSIVASIDCPVMIGNRPASKRGPSTAAAVNARAASSDSGARRRRTARRSARGSPAHCHRRDCQPSRPKLSDPADTAEASSSSTRNGSPSEKRRTSVSMSSDSVSVPRQSCVIAASSVAVRRRNSRMVALRRDASSRATRSAGRRRVGSQGDHAQHRNRLDVVAEVLEHRGVSGSAQ